MSNEMWWIIIASWSVCVLIMFAWMWWTIRKSNKARDWDALFETVSGIPTDGRKQGALEPDYAYRQRLSREAVQPITENQWQQNARQAEALGFLDNDYPRAS